MEFFLRSYESIRISIMGASTLIKKVYIPKYIFPFEKCLFALENFIFSLIAVILVMLFQQFVPPATALLFFIPVLYCFIFSVGIGLILSALAVFFRDVVHLYSIVLTIWMYITPIIYPVEIVQDSAVIFGIIQCNPMYYYVGYFRDLLMYNTIPDLRWNLICILFSLGALALGLLVFKKTQDKFILHI